MIDNFQASRTPLEVIDEGDFYRVKRVPLFRTFAISRTDKNGDPVFIQANEYALNQIVKNFSSDGNLNHGGTPPLMDRHRKHGDDRAAKPDVLGYMENPEIGYMRNKPFLFFDEVVKKDKWDLYQKRPYRSCEYDSSGFNILGCAALIDVPQLNLGAVMSVDGKMFHCFSKEEGTMDELKELKDQIANLSAKLTAIEASNAAVAQKVDEAPKKSDVTNLEASNKELREILDKQNAYIMNLEAAHKKVTATTMVDGLIGEGYVIKDRDKAITKIANFNDEQRAEWANEVRENYSKSTAAPVHRVPVSTDNVSGIQNFAGRYSPEVMNQALTLAGKKNISVTDAIAELTGKN